jgi:hypothetical protein
MFLTVERVFTGGSQLETLTGLAALPLHANAAALASCKTLANSLQPARKKGASLIVLQMRSE